MKNLIFIGGLFPKELRKDIEKNSKGVIQNAADSLQWAIVKGLDHYTTNLQIINLPYVGSYPNRYRTFKIDSFSFSHNKKSHDWNVGFVNVSLYKMYSRYHKTKIKLKELLNNDNEIIIIYALHTPFIKAAVDLKKINPSLKICVIVPDLPHFMGGSNNVVIRFFKKKEKVFLETLLRQVDAFVLLSDYMHKPLNVANRPWVRIEGIFNDDLKSNVLQKESFKTILYTGTLSRRYGILNLLDAFSLIKDVNYRLWICGDGEGSEEINQRCKIDSRIIFFGQLPREEALKLQQKATVLVNPRTSGSEFTKYSFPSKIIEYLASGTPCIMYRLAGIPKEYFNYCFVPTNETPFALYHQILMVCSKSQEELNQLGLKAQRFILENKTPEKQCLKLYNMLQTYF